VFFAEYWGQPKKTADCFVDGYDGEWYLSGDLGNKDDEGYFWFEGRADDVILSSGYRTGPFEVESSLGEHDAVAESAVVPKTDEKRGNIVKAYVVTSEDTGDAQAGDKTARQGRTAGARVPARGRVRRRPAEDGDGQDTQEEATRTGARRILAPLGRRQQSTCVT
jgi:acyl-coenzyme A synthetase/AMP-(fatty) acid ligase